MRDLDTTPMRQVEAVVVLDAPRSTTSVVSTEVEIPGQSNTS
jgi:hypothetical protein